MAGMAHYTPCAGIQTHGVVTRRRMPDTKKVEEERAEECERREREEEGKKTTVAMEKPSEVARIEKAKEDFLMDSEVGDCDVDEDDESNLDTEKNHDDFTMQE